MGELLAAVASWLERTALSQRLQTAEWVVPTVQTIHILAIAAVMGAMLFFNLRLLGLRGTEVPLARVSSRFIPVLWTAVLVLLVSGVVMIVAEPGRSLPNPVFQLKMVLLFAALVLTFGMVRPLRRRPDYWADSSARGWVARLGAISSLGLWVAILFAGRWIAYTRVH
jgi:putative copper export protein